MIYDSGTLYAGAVQNGRYDLLLGSGTTQLELYYGRLYYLDMEIDSQDVDFNGSERQMFQSSVGKITGTYINNSAISSVHVLDGSLTGNDISNDSIDKEKIDTSGTWLESEIPSLTNSWPGTVHGSKIISSNLMDVNNSQYLGGYSASVFIENDSALNQKISSINTSASVKRLGFNLTSELDSRYLQSFTETDRQVGLVTANKWAIGNGSALNANLTIPTCSGTDKLTCNGYTCSCATDQSGGGDDLTISNLTVNNRIVLKGYPLLDAEPDYWNPVYLEFLCSGATTCFDPLMGVVISTGAIATVAGTNINPGVIQLRDSGTANGGYRIMSDVGAFRINGTESARFIFQDVEAASTGQYRFGFQDSTTVTAPTDGCVINVTNNILNGYCRNNNAQTTTSTSYTLSDSTWYDARIEINADASSVDFSLWSLGGSRLWNNTVSSNIPKTAGRETGFGIIATESTTDAASGIINIDFMSLRMKRKFAR